MADQPASNETRQPLLREDLHARLDQLERDFRLLSVNELARRAAALEQRAAALQLEATATAARELGQSLGACGRSAPAYQLFEALRGTLPPADRVTAQRLPPSLH